MAKEQLSLMNEPFHDELAVCSVHSQPRHPPSAFVNEKPLHWHWDAVYKLCGA